MEVFDEEIVNGEGEAEMRPDGDSTQARRKWTSAFRVMQGIQRFKHTLNLARHHEYSSNVDGNASAAPRGVSSSNESTPSREVVPVDPVYLALKQATSRYTGTGTGTGCSRRSSSTHLGSGTPSPRNLSQASLQDSGYSEVMVGMYRTAETRSQPRMLGSTPHLDQRDPLACVPTGVVNSASSAAVGAAGRRRAPKLTKQMKSLSLDCAEMPPRVNNAQTRSPMRGRLLPRTAAVGGRSGNGSGSDLSDWERSCSPSAYAGAYGPPNHSRRSSSSAMSSSPSYVVIHEYAPSNGAMLCLGERMHVVDNGDPDWLHGFKIEDRTERLYSFPATCVAMMKSSEQPMKIVQNVLIADQKLRLYRDQVVFAQPETMREGKVTVRTERDAYVPVPLSHVALL